MYRFAGPKAFTSDFTDFMDKRKQIREAVTPRPGLERRPGRDSSRFIAPALFKPQYFKDRGTQRSL